MITVSEDLHGEKIAGTKKFFQTTQKSITRTNTQNSPEREIQLRNNDSSFLRAKVIIVGEKKGVIFPSTDACKSKSAALQRIFFSQIQVTRFNTGTFRRNAMTFDMQR